MAKKDTGGKDNASVGPVLPRRPTKGLKQGTAAFPVAQRPSEDSWAEQPASNGIVATTDETGATSESDDPPPKGATLPTGPYVFVDKLAPAPANARVNISELVQSVADSDPEMAGEIRDAYAEGTPDNANVDEANGEPANEPASGPAIESADDSITDGDEDTSVDWSGPLNVDAEFKRVMGGIDNIAGVAPVSEPSEEKPLAEKEDDMTTDKVDAHAATTATPTIPGANEPAPADSADKKTGDAAIEVPAPPSLPEKVAELPKPIESTPMTATHVPAVAAVPAKGATTAKPVTPVKGPVKSKHEAETVTLPKDDKTKPAVKTSRGFQIALVTLAVAAIALVGVVVYPIAKDRTAAISSDLKSAPAMKVEPRPVELDAKAKAAISAVEKKALPAPAKPSTKLATGDPAVTPESVDAAPLSVGLIFALLDKRFSMVPDSQKGHAVVDPSSPIADYATGEKEPETTAQVLPAMTEDADALKELDTMVSCTNMPTNNPLKVDSRFNCAWFATLQVLYTENWNLSK